jgi:hypothetical protein
MLPTLLNEKHQFINILQIPQLQNLLWGCAPVVANPRTDLKVRPFHPSPTLLSMSLICLYSTAQRSPFKSDEKRDFRKWHNITEITLPWRSQYVNSSASARVNNFSPPFPPRQLRCGPGKGRILRKGCQLGPHMHVKVVLLPGMQRASQGRPR